MRLEREHNGRAWLAWHIAALERVRKLPKLERFIGAKPQKPQTTKQMREIVKMYHVIHGGEDKRKKK